MARIGCPEGVVGEGGNEGIGVKIGRVACRAVGRGLDFILNVLGNQEEE